MAVKHNRLSADVVNIGSYLESIGFERYICYTGDAKPTVREYLKRARKKLKVCDAKVRKRIKEAKFVFIGEGHAVGSHDLKYYDTWDCGDIRITEIYAKFPK